MKTKQEIREEMVRLLERALTYAKNDMMSASFQNKSKAEGLEWVLDE